MKPATSPYWKDLKRYGNVPGCISVPPQNADCTTWCTKFWTTRLTKPWPDKQILFTSPCKKTSASASKITAAVSPWICTPPKINPALQSSSSEEHTSEHQSRGLPLCPLWLEKKID